MRLKHFFMLIICIFVISCSDKNVDEHINRHSLIPSDVVKGTPSNDQHPPEMHSSDFDNPVPLAVINTAGAEDSPFIPDSGDELYFVFVKDVREEVHIQIRDEANGIWLSKYINGWQEPEFVRLQKKGSLALNGCEFVSGDTMLFCTAREGYTGMHWFSAERKDGAWSGWENADFNPDFQVGELHVHGDELYYHSNRGGGSGGSDIWKLTKINGEWIDPENVKVVNSEVDEGMPYISSDGSELWFNRWYQGSPAVFRSKKISGEWSSPELIVSSFAGEPTLDKFGNLYFVHHFYRDGEMIEADIYIAYKK